MAAKKEYIILGIIIIALVTYLALHTKDRTGYVLPAIPAVAGDAVSAIEISKGDSSIRLEKKKGAWRVTPGEYPANSDIIVTMTEALAAFTLTTLVAESQSFARYGLDEAGRITVRAWAEKEMVRHIDIGNTASTYQHTFVRLPGDGNVYHARSNLRTVFDKTVKDLRENRVLSFSKSDIRRIRVAQAREDIELATRDETKDAARLADEKTSRNAAPLKRSQWYDTKRDEPADEKAVDRLLDLCADLRCTEFMEDKEPRAGDAIIRVEIEDTKVHVLSIFTREGATGDYPASSSESAALCTLAPSRVDALRDAITAVLPAKKTQ